MIRKYFVIGKKLYLQSKSSDSLTDLGHVIELHMPIETYWSMKDFFKEIDYMRSAGLSQQEIHEKFKQVFKICAPYAILEKERKWLYERSSDK